MRKIKNPTASFLRTFTKPPSNLKNIPIFINNFNRVDTLKKLIYSLEKRGFRNIHILDNKSTYPPLLEYYKTTPYTVFRLKKNYGSKAFWKSGLWWKYITSYFVYTDSDVVIKEECPDNFMHYFLDFLKKHPKVHKIGFSLCIDDLPDHYKHKQAVIDWEKKYYQNSFKENVYIAPIDTTFALYRPFSKAGKTGSDTLMLRTDSPYQAKHLPWYIDSDNLCEEEQFYVDTIAKEKTHWSQQH